MVERMKAKGWADPLGPLGLGSGAPPAAAGDDAKQPEEAGKRDAPGSPGAAASEARALGAQPRRTLAEDWASLLLALRAPVVWSGAIWRMFYLTCLNGFTFFTPLIIKSLLGASVGGQVGWDGLDGERRGAGRAWAGWRNGRAGQRAWLLCSVPRQPRPRPPSSVFPTLFIALWAASWLFYRPPRTPRWCC